LVESGILVKFSGPATLSGSASGFLNIVCSGSTIAVDFNTALALTDSVTFRISSIGDILGEIVGSGANIGFDRCRLPASSHDLSLRDASFSLHNSLCYLIVSWSYRFLNLRATFLTDRVHTAVFPLLEIIASRSKS